MTTETNKIKLIKMSNRDELLAEVVAKSDRTTTIRQPIRVVYAGVSKADPKTPNIGFLPWAEFSDDKDFTIDNSHIVCIMNPIPEFLNQYKSLFGGLVLPQNSNKLILPR